MEVGSRHKDCEERNYMTTHENCGVTFFLFVGQFPARGQTFRGRFEGQSPKRIGRIETDQIPARG